MGDWIIRTNIKSLLEKVFYKQYKDGYDIERDQEIRKRTNSKNERINA